MEHSSERQVEAVVFSTRRASIIDTWRGAAIGGAFEIAVSDIAPSFASYVPQGEMR